MSWQVAVVRHGPSSYSPDCGVEATGRSVSLRAAVPNQAAASDPASNGVLQLQGQLPGQGGGNFLVWQLLLWVHVILHHGLEILRSGTTERESRKGSVRHHKIMMLSICVAAGDDTCSSTNFTNALSFMHFKNLVT